MVCNGWVERASRSETSAALSLALRADRDIQVDKFIGSTRVKMVLPNLENKINERGVKCTAFKRQKATDDDDEQRATQVECPCDA